MVATAQLTADFLHIVSATIPQSGARLKPLRTVRVAERDAGPLLGWRPMSRRKDT